MYKVNILPLELHDNINFDVNKLIKVMTVSIIAVVLLIGYGAFVFRLYMTGKEIAETEKELAQLQDTVKQVEEIKKQRQNNELIVQNFKDLVDNRKTWSNMLEELNSYLPVDIWLESIDVSFIEPQSPAGIDGQGGGQTKTQAKGMPARSQTNIDRTGTGKESNVDQDLKGISQLAVPSPNVLTVEGYSRSLPSVGIFVNSLGKMPYIKKIRLSEIKKDDGQAAVKFKITATIGESGE
ncbi:MAG: Fimbrial assembly protein (PilN) [Pelotomaculum sp. PtaB.Bin013]|uniref:PilN domain-containing protein n=1 Tax=Pelotomaculum isophthalicicum JI TaxID=947010 RepID=A0A9X4H227_9FIRM|nr:PilN domain-containing protein [Pelotomaculum isophthalicicum]MDF9408616.1 PilN domain-containing protein [Pelotomaculum isophthalicicum JI]OPX87098.1 MAG: Fimbrial assembly protein (PilN) [Pelotomaculum sp. PtaB.Bin013]